MVCGALEEPVLVSWGIGIQLVVCPRCCELPDALQEPSRGSTCCYRLALPGPVASRHRWEGFQNSCTTLNQQHQWSIRTHFLHLNRLKAYHSFGSLYLECFVASLDDIPRRLVGSRGFQHRPLYMYTWEEPRSRTELLGTRRLGTVGLLTGIWKAFRTISKKKGHHSSGRSSWMCPMVRSLSGCGVLGKWDGRGTRDWARAIVYWVGWLLRANGGLKWVSWRRLWSCFWMVEGAKISKDSRWKYTSLYTSSSTAFPIFKGVQGLQVTLSVPTTKRRICPQVYILFLQLRTSLPLPFRGIAVSGTSSFVYNCLRGCHVPETHRDSMAKKQSNSSDKVDNSFHLHLWTTG